MKNLKIYFVSTAVLFTLLFFSCTSESTISDFSSSQQDINIRNVAVNHGLLLPNETQFANDHESINFTLPAGYNLIGYDDNGQSRSSTSGSLTCTCETAGSTGKCSPTETKNTVGCNTEKSNSCPECKGKLTSISTNGSHELTEYYVKTPSNQSTTYSLFSDIRAAVDLDEWSNLSWLDITNIDESEIQEMLDYAWEDHIETEPTVDILMVSSAGKFTMQIPATSLEGGNIYTSTGKLSCSGCNNACTLKKAAFGKVRYCDGCNSGCTISW